MGFLDKLFGRKKKEPDQAESTPAPGASMQEPASGGGNMPEPTSSPEQGGGGMPSGGESGSRSGGSS
jgi:hypothetical protein